MKVGILANTDSIAHPGRHIVVCCCTIPVIVRPNIPLLAATVLLAAVCAQAQAIRGQVLVPSAQGIDKIEVVVEKPSGQVLTRTYTNEEGTFVFPTIPGGDWYVVVRLDGFKEARERIYLTAGGSTRILIPLIRDDQAVALSTAASGVVDVDDLSQRYPKKVVDEYEKGRDDLRKGNDAKAIERFQTVVKDAPDFAQAHNALGTAFQKLQRFDDAAKEYLAARDLNPRWAEPLVNLGGMRAQFGDPARARQELQDALALDASSGMAHYYLGVANYKLLIYPDAEQNLQRSLELSPGFAPSRIALVNLYVRLQRWQDALSQIDLYLAENRNAPERPQIVALRAKVIANTK